MADFQDMPVWRTDKTDKTLWKEDTATVIIGKVNAGRWSPERAEAVAARLRLKPFASSPQNIDISAMPFWSLPMAICWATQRKLEAVLSASDAYLTQCWRWQPIRQINLQKKRGPYGPETHITVMPSSGHELAQPEPMTYRRLEIEQLFDRHALMSVDEAWQDIVTAGQMGLLEAWATEESGATLRLGIGEWLHVQIASPDHTGDRLKRGQRILRCVRIKSADLVSIFAPIAPVRTSPEAVVRGKRGPKFKYDWSDFLREAKIKLEYEGSIAPINGSSFTQADLEGQMETWCLKKWESVPSESQIRKYVVRALRDYEADNVAGQN